MRTDELADSGKSLREVALGGLAGALAGLAASYTMSKFHSLFQPPASAPAPADEDSTVKAASRMSRAILKRELPPEYKQTAGAMVHYGFGAAVAGLYGAAVEFIPGLRAGVGVAFGVTVWAAAHGIAVPALGLSAPITQSAPGAEAVELGAHIVYGVVAERLRHLLRTHIHPRPLDEPRSSASTFSRPPAATEQPHVTFCCSGAGLEVSSPH